MQIPINEIFNSIQGEGPEVGTPTTFIRVYGCDISPKCSWCFGIKKSFHVPYVYDVNLQKRVKITNLKVGNEILTLDDATKENVKTTIKKIIKRKVDEYYKLKINKYIYFVTPEHLFFTNKGLKKCKDLKVGDEITSLKQDNKKLFDVGCIKSVLKDKNKMKKKNSKRIYYKKVNFIKLQKGKLDVINLSCAPYNTFLIDYMWVHNCDTPYSWSNAKENNQLMPMSNLLKKIFEAESHHFTITGGEPTLYDEQLLFLRKLISAQHMSLETNGTRLTKVPYNTIVISPKEQDVHMDVLKSYAEMPNTFFKFVYEPGKEKWWEGIPKEVEMPNHRVYVMPEGRTREEQLSRMEEVANYCIEKKFKFSPRLHILTWNTKRGV